MANENLSQAKKAKNDEFYTQFSDIEKEINAYIEYNPDVFKGKTILLPCDDPEWSNFTKYFAQNFKKFGLKKLISTSYAHNSKEYDGEYIPTLFETIDPKYDENKTKSNGKIFILDKDKTGDGKIDVEDLEWEYLEGDGDFRSEEVKKLRNESDIIITNPPFSLFREFLAWIVEADKEFLMIGNLNAITYKEVFPLIMNNGMWLGPTMDGRNKWFKVPESYPIKENVANSKIENGEKFLFVKGCIWFTNLDHGRRHQPLALMTMADNKRYNKSVINNPGFYQKYENYNAIEVSRVDGIPSDYTGVMGVPISFLNKYNPDQFEILGNGQTMANELGIKPVGKKFVDDYYAQGNKGSINERWNNLVYRIKEKTVVPYQRILIKFKK